MASFEWPPCPSCGHTIMRHAIRGLVVRCDGPDGPRAEFSASQVVAAREAVGMRITPAMREAIAKEGGASAQPQGLVDRQGGGVENA